MNPFQKRTAIRIAIVSILTAVLGSAIAWYVARESAEEAIVSLAMEESSGLLQQFGAMDSRSPDSRERAAAAAKAISGGLFDIAEIYDSWGQKLAESVSPEGHAVEASLPKHRIPRRSAATYESLKVAENWVLRVMVPLRASETDANAPVAGYFEGVRVVPDWQRQQVIHTSLVAALMVGLASLLCGAALYPVVVRLSRENERKSREVVESQAALIDALRKSEVELEDKINQRTLELQTEQKRTKDLLHNILPAEVADELSATGSVKPTRHELVTILFSDFSGFTQAVSTMPADRMIAELNEIFEAFDDIADRAGVEKIKTIGDSYMAAAGLPTPCVDHARRCVAAALEMIAYLEERNRTAAFKWAIRVGIHSGPVVAGVVGKRKYAFDVWGDTVNIASRMESAGDPGRVNISAYTYDLVRNEYDCEYRGKVHAKGKGGVDMYFVVAPKTPA